MIININCSVVYIYCFIKASSDLKSSWQLRVAKEVSNQSTLTKVFVKHNFDGKYYVKKQQHYLKVPFCF